MHVNQNKQAHKEFHPNQQNPGDNYVGHMKTYTSSVACALLLQRSLSSFVSVV